MTKAAEGWAVVSNGKINVRTVNPTRRGALVNWLVVEGKVMVYASDSDVTIENAWRAKIDDNTICAPVWIRRTGDDE